MKVFTAHSDMIHKQPVDGADGRIVHGAGLTVAHWDLAAGTVIPMHHHVHEQIALVVSGELELTVGDEVHVLRPGDSAVIPGSVPHEARAVSDCRVIDAFSPPREDLV